MDVLAVIKCYDPAETHMVLPPSVCEHLFQGEPEDRYFYLYPSNDNGHLMRIEYINDTIQFAEWLLELGEGKLGGDNDGNAIIEILCDLLIRDSNDPLSDLIDFVYPALFERCNNISYFQERAILAPLNEVVEEINDRFLYIFPCEEVEYLSSDSLDNFESVGPGFDSALHSPDFLNSLKISGMPNHRLVLKVGVPIMLLRNIDQKNGLCNGTRLQVISLGKCFIEVKVISSTNIGFRTYITRSGLTPTDKKLPFKLKRR